MDLNKLKALAAAATPGPWAHRSTLGGWSGVFERTMNADVAICALQLNHPANADFITAANPATVLELIALTERIQAELTAERAAKAQGAADPVVEANRALLLERSQVGMAKYGTTLARAGLGRPQLLRHLLEELLDGANYAQAELMREAAAPSIQALPVVAPTDLHAAIMNLPHGKLGGYSTAQATAYKMGHRDARHAAAELAAAQPEAKEAPAALSDEQIRQLALRSGAATGRAVIDGRLMVATGEGDHEIMGFAHALLAAAGNSQDAKDAARWRFMMRAGDDENSPEMQAIERLGSDVLEDDRPNSVQMVELTDAAIAAMAAAPSPAEDV